MKEIFPIDVFRNLSTPFYFYDISLLKTTLEAINECICGTPFHVHYAIKANANPAVLAPIASAGMGADCVSAGEIRAAVDAGFPADKIFFAGVGKSDYEIEYALDAKIGCFNIESVEELAVIAEIAAAKKTVATIALRVNPNIDAHTHEYITTGLKENKFGIALEMLDDAIDFCSNTPSLNLRGLHFHIGSQVLTMEPYRLLCERVNTLLARYSEKGIHFDIINVGGGLGIDYDNPDEHPVADFNAFFNVFKEHLHLNAGQQLHFELGRAIVGQCGSLITKVLFVKDGLEKKFVIVDAGMTELLRPSLYQAHHNIENITTASTETEVYDVVGPICESSDCFGTDERLPVTLRGDLLAIRSAGAYGESMMLKSYNLRPDNLCYATE